MDHTSPAYSNDTFAAGNPCAAVANPILDDVRFQTLVRSRRIFSWSLTAVMLILYFAFILTLAFSPDLLGRRISADQPCTWGIPVGFGMFVITFALVAVYVFRANTVFDAAASKIKEGVRK
ncbi:DUF485 domain-containing protein [Caballeronia sp. S22]|uniref:DUF485 domain-containing protein n=1 Tax=Caballeronia sp. S22 TaxID=3137182 RepID=UPI0035315B4C